MAEITPGPPSAPKTLYDPLDIDRYEIRVLTLLAGALGSIVRCHLQKTTLINTIEYSAVSYCWGDPALTKKIMVNDIEVLVTISLADALSQLRTIGVSLVWADAVCINQNDALEKNNQIRKMKLVYSRAQQTYALVGAEEINGFAAAWDFFLSPTALQPHIKAREDQHTYSQRCTGNGTSPPSHISSQSNPSSILLPLTDSACIRCQLTAHFRALKEFFRSPYWVRLWIIQEVAFASQVEIICGQSRFSISKLDAAINRARKSSLRFWNWYVENAYEHVKTVFKFRDYQHSAQRVSLCEAIYMTRKAISTDPRDRILALLGLTYDGPDLVPIPNYLQPMEVLQREMTRRLIQRTHNLQILSMKPQSGNISTTLPSWAPDWFNPALPAKFYDIAKEKDRHVQSGPQSASATSFDDIQRACAAIVRLVISISKAVGLDS
ncbi:hypothetical protein N431DRAFT_141531 [Stipitochalara longipes BDJ]|nr:hypothetical protein N431DRAFT_141531 [Stipitochalara longipes BDJ]